MPVGQSLFLSQGVPAIPLCGCEQVSLWQTRLPLQVLFVQQLSETPPQPGAPLLDPLLLVEPLLDPLVVAEVAPELLPLVPELLAGAAQTLARQASPVSQAAPLQQVWPLAPHAGVEPEDEHPERARETRHKIVIERIAFAFLGSTTSTDEPEKTADHLLTR
jgi:hypothetical protein